MVKAWSSKEIGQYMNCEADSRWGQLREGVKALTGNRAMMGLIRLLVTPVVAADCKRGWTYPYKGTASLG